MMRFKIVGLTQKKALAIASAFFNEAHLRCMKNEAAFGYEAWLRHTENLECASLHASENCLAIRERFVATKLPLHICEANASLTKV